MNTTDNTLRVRRAEKRVNQFQVAAAVGLSRDRYWRIENGYAAATEEEIVQLATYFGSETVVLFPAAAAA